MSFKVPTIAVLGSHSALDVCAGAKKYGLKTLVICQKGREATYANYYHSQEKIGCVDQCIVLAKFSDVLSTKVQRQLKSLNAIFIPHRSFEVYLNFNYKAIENNFKVPIFGNRWLLKIEERGVSPNQYDLLKKASIPFPKQFSKPNTIDRLCLVKVLEAERGFERAFFLVKNYKDFQKQVTKKLAAGVFSKKELSHAIIEEFVVGVQVNFNFFYSPLLQRLELLGTDARRQTNLDGILRAPACYQDQILSCESIKYEEAGHVAVTVLESLLEPAFGLGERFVTVSKKLFPPGVIGPFALQTLITPGPPKKEIIVIDVSPRMPGSPGISATPYSSYLYGKPVSVGERIAIEIKAALKQQKLCNILT